MFIFLLFFFSIQQIQSHSKPSLHIVKSPVADLRFQPESAAPHLKLPTTDITNAGQVTQLLFGEYVQTFGTTIDQDNKMWLWIHALQQERFDPDLHWHGYPGWILADDLQPIEQFSQHNVITQAMMTPIFNHNQNIIQYFSIGSRLCATRINETWWQFLLDDKQIAYVHHHHLYFLDNTVQETPEQLRNNIIKKAKEFLGNLYSWGGRSAQDDTRIVSSVDCSALVNLCFLANGLQIPRMSHEQFLRSNKIANCQDLQPADLIFFVSITKQSLRMDHVMMYLGNDQILESTAADDQKVRIISFSDRFGKNCNSIQNNDIIEWNNEHFHVFFGSFLNDPTLIQKLRDNALKFNY